MRDIQLGIGWINCIRTNFHFLITFCMQNVIDLINASYILYFLCICVCVCRWSWLKFRRNCRNNIESIKYISEKIINKIFFEEVHKKFNEVFYFNVQLIKCLKGSSIKNKSRKDFIIKIFIIINYSI